MPVDGHRPWFETLTGADLAKVLAPRPDPDAEEAAQDVGSRTALGNSRTHGVKIVWTQIETDGRMRDVVIADASELWLRFGFSVDRKLRDEGQLRLIWEVGDYAFPGRLRSVRTVWTPVSSFGDGDVVGVGQGYKEAAYAITTQGLWTHSLRDGDGRYWWRPSVALSVPGSDPARQHFAIGPQHSFLVLEASDPKGEALQGVSEGDEPRSDRGILTDLNNPDIPLPPDIPAATKGGSDAGIILIAIVAAGTAGLSLLFGGLGWKPPQYELVPVAPGDPEAGRLRARDGTEDNLIRVGLGPEIAPAGYTRITLTAGQTVTWWKGLGFSQEGSTPVPTIRPEHAVSTEGSRTAMSMDVPSDLIGPNARLWLSQGKFLGIPTITGWIGSDVLQLLKGHHLLVYWQRDTYAGQVAVIT